MPSKTTTLRSAKKRQSINKKSENTKEIIRKNRKTYSEYTPQDTNNNKLYRNCIDSNVDTKLDSNVDTKLDSLEGMDLCKYRKSFLMDPYFALRRKKEMKLVSEKKKLSNKRGKSKIDVKRYQCSKLLNDPSEALTAVDKLGECNRRILRVLFDLLLEDKVTPKISMEFTAHLCGVKNFKNFMTYINRLYGEAILDKVATRSRSGGVLFWFHPNIYETLKNL